MQVDFIRVAHPNGYRSLCSGCAHQYAHATACNKVNGIAVPEEASCWFNMDGKLGASIWIKVEQPKARVTDPATSKGNRKVNKYEEAVLTALAGANLNGKEIAHVSEQPLNCITPRFAPLRRKGLIADSGVTRDKQIVWVRRP